MSLLEKMKKQSVLAHTDVLSESKIFNSVDLTPTDVPMINVALSGRFDGGFGSGATLIAGPSRHFKTAFMLVMIKAFQKKHPNGVVQLFDNEFGSPQQYFKNFDIDMDRVLYTPFTNIEELKFETINQLDKLERGDEVMIAIDSLGNAASKKEVQDAKDQKSVADMTRAKQIKSFWRMVIPYLKLKNIPMVGIAHTYQTQEMYSKAVVGGGTGQYYGPDNIWIVGRQQVKEGTELQGYNFIINVEKSRFVKEKSKIPLTVTFEGGVDTFSGLLEIALAGGFVVKPKMGWYCYGDPKTKQALVDHKNLREADTHKTEFWDPLLKDPRFQEFVKTYFTIGYRSEIEGQFLSDVKMTFEDDHDERAGVATGEDNSGEGEGDE